MHLGLTWEGRASLGGMHLGLTREGGLAGARMGVAGARKIIARVVSGLIFGSDL